MTSRALTGGLFRLSRRMPVRAAAQRREDGGINLEQAAKLSPVWGRAEVRHEAHTELSFPQPGRVGGWI